MNWGKHNECELSIERPVRWRFILRTGSVYAAILWVRVRLVWNSAHEGVTLVEA
jgi:hypothetical protein